MSATSPTATKTLAAPLAAENSLGKIHALLAVQTVVIILGSINRLGMWRHGQQPMVVYYSVAYTLSLIATAIYKITSG